MPAGVLAEGNLTIDQRRFDGRELGRPQALFAQQLVYRIGAGSSQKHAFRVRPSISVGSTAADKRAQAAGRPGVSIELRGNKAAAF